MVVSGGYDTTRGAGVKLVDGRYTLTSMQDALLGGNESVMTDRRGEGNASIPKYFGDSVFRNHWLHNLSIYFVIYKICLDQILFY